MPFLEYADCYFVNLPHMSCTNYLNGLTIRVHNTSDAAIITYKDCWFDAELYGRHPGDSSDVFFGSYFDHTIGLGWVGLLPGQHKDYNMLPFGVQSGLESFYFKFTVTLFPFGDERRAVQINTQRIYDASNFTGPFLPDVQVCVGHRTVPIEFPAPDWATIQWTSSEDIGIGFSGAGKIPSFLPSGVNYNTQITVTGHAGSCQYQYGTFNITVLPDVFMVFDPQIYGCHNGEPISIVPTSESSGIVQYTVRQGGQTYIVNNLHNVLPPLFVGTYPLQITASNGVCESERYYLELVVEQLPVIAVPGSITADSVSPNIDIPYYSTEGNPITYSVDVGFAQFTGSLEPNQITIPNVLPVGTTIATITVMSQRWSSPPILVQIIKS